MAHPAKQKPTGGPDGQPMTANIQLSVRGRWKYRGCSVQEPYLRCLSVSEASAGRQLWQIIRLPLGPDSTHTFTHTNTRVHRPTRRFKKKKSLNLTTDRCVFRLHVIILCGMQPRWWQLGVMWAGVEHSSCADRSREAWHCTMALDGWTDKLKYFFIFYFLPGLYGERLP